eukprot:10847556-Heterocapsa_arctica.AAC.1
MEEFAMAHPPRRQQVQTDVMCCKHETCYDKKSAKLYFKLTLEWRHIELIILKWLTGLGGEHL